MSERKKQVVVLGAGFGGLEFCKHFRAPHTAITVVDRTNHHLFQPLLYQVATAGLSAPDIAQPVRAILSGRTNVTVLMETVTGIDLVKKKVHLTTGEMPYDYLVLALGGATSYFGHPEWEPFAPGLKSISDALNIRNKVLLAFEHAEAEPKGENLERLLTIVVVGGGPTGVELAGAFAELANHVLRRDFRHIDPARARVILLEAGPRILANLSETLSSSATRQLKKMGVHVRTGTKVKSISEHRIELEDGEVVHTANIIWAAGVNANPLTSKLGVELDRTGRVKVQPDLSLREHPEVFAIGDMALVLDSKDKPVPGVSPAAMQMARHAAQIIEAEIQTHGSKKARPPFRYFDKGSMATIGRSAAVAQVGKLEFSGLLAWLAWLAIHLIFLVGFRNKIAVILQWFYSYITYRRGARLITPANVAAPTKSHSSSSRSA